jgi:hypothetical protein
MKSYLKRIEWMYDIGVPLDIQKIIALYVFYVERAEQMKKLNKQFTRSPLRRVCAEHLLWSYCKPLPIFITSGVLKSMEFPNAAYGRSYPYSVIGGLSLDIGSGFVPLGEDTAVTWYEQRFPDPVLLSQDNMRPGYVPCGQRLVLFARYGDVKEGRIYIRVYNVVDDALNGAIQFKTSEIRKKVTLMYSTHMYSHLDD